MRRARIDRTTAETSIALEIDLDGTGAREIATGVGFFDHMLDHIARHGRFGLTVNATGDTHVDDHHTVEDVGICLGQAFAKALGDKAGIERYGFASVPMDEALARVSIDLSGRAALVFDVRFTEPLGKIGTFDHQLVREFCNALAGHLPGAVHVEVPHGENDHHIAEAIFKGLGRALHAATRQTRDDLPSTKGSL